jgi:hypothetical protein
MRGKALPFGDMDEMPWVLISEEPEGKGVARPDRWFFGLFAASRGPSHQEILKE